MGDDDLSEQIKETAESPARMGVDGRSADQQPIPDLIEADRYLKSKKAVQKGNRGLRMSKISFPGAQ